jgi:hypothetical protein
MKLPKLKYTILSIACLSGLVSCYPVDPMNPYGRQGQRPSGLRTQAELEAAAQQRADLANAEVTAIQQSKERLEREERERLEAERREAAGYANNGGTITPEPKPIEVKPNVVKFAAPVPNKAGFVYNPYTQNQVDVRGIPSGTKVRDPHDPNPAHVFRVP